MSLKVSNKPEEIAPGPTEIRRKPDGQHPELLGYGLVQYNSDKELFESYFVIKKNTPFPFPTGDVGSELSFKRIDAPEDSPEKFYEWALHEGALGDDVETWSSTEKYAPWKI